MLHLGDIDKYVTNYGNHTPWGRIGNFSRQHCYTHQNSLTGLTEILNVDLWWSDYFLNQSIKLYFEILDNAFLHINRWSYFGEI